MKEYKIIFLGTAGISAVGEQIRSSGGIIFKFENIQIHLNPGPGALSQAIRCKVNPRNTNLVLVSNNDIARCNDVNAIIDSMTYSGFDKRGLLMASKSVIYGDEKERPYLSKFHRGCIEQYIAISQGQEVKVNTFLIKGTKTRHSDETSIGFKILTKRFNLGYVGDTAFFFELIDEFRSCDILIINNERTFKEDGKDSLSSNDVIRIIENIKPKLVILTGFGEKFLLGNILYEIREIQKKTFSNILMAKDGLVVYPLEYVGARQKTLASY